MKRALVLAVLFTTIAVPALSGKKDKGKDKVEEAPAMDAAAAQAIADYRHNFFEGLGKHMKLSAMIVKGQVDAPKADLVLHAHALHNASTALPHWFPQGTGPGSVKTDALDTIWQDAEGFKAATQKFQAASAKLVEAADAGDLDAFKAQFGAVGQSCGGCHDSFRKDED